jgi:class 3 adenylate cyclase/tetratricopeptide (TPR) repeat protein
MRCQRCEAENPAGKRFCLKCGQSLAAVCPSCATPIEPGALFCGDCGASLSGVPAEPPRAPVRQAERRVCSVLFCDLVGFTPLSEARDPEEVRELLSRYFEAAGAAIRRYGGVVEKFIGDAVMAVWGTPVATEGDAERAVRAGLDLVDTVRSLGFDSGVVDLAARVGVVTGEVAVTIGATNEGMVAGDAVNTAARVQSIANPGQVLVDATTRRLASSAIDFGDPMEALLKGKAAAEELWPARRVLSGVGGAQRVDGLEAPLTGRDAEMRTIRELFHAVVERRVPRLIVVAGPAGVGKSRLGWEFEKYVDGLAETVRWHRGRCLSYGEGVAFWALAEIVRQRLGIAEDDVPEVASIKLDQGLATHLRDEDERSYVGARLARLLGVSYAGDKGGEMVREELFAGWRLFFARLAEEQPVVLMVEDAHHADPGMLDFLDHLIDWSQDLPIFVLVFGRSELDQVRPGFGAGRNRVVLTLDPLDDTSMVALADALVPGMPAGARDAIVGQAQGIPLFAVETVRSLIDKDVVQPVEGVYRLVADVVELDVPESLHALLASRLDALDPVVRQLVADAAVLGSTFPEEAVVAVSGLDEAAVHEALSVLLRREVLTVSADRLSPERGSYRFAQELLRQVAYETLSRRDRKTRHLAVAGHLQSTFPSDEVADVVARHYLDALEAVPEDADVEAIAERAVTALTRAAERALRTGAPSRAAQSYRTAAELVNAHEDRQRTALLWELASDAALTSGDSPLALELGEEAVRRYEALGEKRSVARVETLVGRALHRLARYKQAREVLTRAVEVLRENPDVDTAWAMDALAGVENFQGSADADQATVESLQMAVGLAVGPARMSGAFLTRGIHLSRVGRYSEAVLYFRESVRIAEASNTTELLGLGLLNLSDAVSPYDSAEGAAVARRAVEVLHRVGNRLLLGTAFLNQSTALLEMGEWEGNAELLKPGGEADIVGEAEPAVPTAQAMLAALRGDVQAAASFATRLDVLRESEDDQARGWANVVDALTATGEGRTSDALALALAALACGKEFNMAADYKRWAWPCAARAALDLGDVKAVAGLLDMLDDEMPGRLPPFLRAEHQLVRARLDGLRADPDAGEKLAQAIEAMRSSGLPHLLAHGLLDYADYLSGAGEASAAALAVVEARTIGERLGCKSILDRADAFPAKSVDVPA